MCDPSPRRVLSLVALRRCDFGLGGLSGNNIWERQEGPLMGAALPAIPGSEAIGQVEIMLYEVTYNRLSH